jgi:hypothetical protein
MHTLKSLHAPMPEMTNRDGETIVFTETRFPLLAKRSDEIIQRLDAATEWDRGNTDEHYWSWLSETNADSSTLQHGVTIESFQGGQRPINGTLELTPEALKLTTNSMERAERGKAALETLLHGLVGPALNKTQTPEQLMAQHDSLDPDPVDNIDPEIATEVIHNMMEQHYRQCLDEPIPALGNKTPRQCARSKKGREKVIEWLKYLENNEQRRATREGQEPYDSGWMWDELKLTKHPE